jgi:hypothetical protein
LFGDAGHGLTGLSGGEHFRRSEVENWCDHTCDCTD